MSIHRPPEQDFRKFQDEEDLQDQEESWFISFLAALFMFMGIVPVRQDTIKSNGLQ
ncbi:MAG: hypothetical protein GF334_13390 [Candidatus Altiarchaeales archaeon]|nr:hypothetical protein [Candidatus Altiarchaeales archaeon]